jgi:predicted aminopeptidase
MILNDKTDCTEFLARILDQTQAWRRKTAAEYADDPRNEKAARMLDQLAIDSANLSDQQWTELRPHFGWSSQIFRAGVVQAAKMVGFAHRNSSFDSFVRLVVKQLPTSRVAA